MPPTRNQGFTLIEVMIVVVIISILSAVAIPMYKDYVIRARIMKAVALLSSRQTGMEQCFQDNHKYLATCKPCADAADGDTAKDFTYACSVTPTTFTLTATGAGPMAGFEYTVDQGNAKTSKTGAGWGGTSTSCWITKKDGSC